jgi:hypothetical protein
MPAFRNHLSVPSSKAGYEAFDDGTDRWFRNVGIQKSDAGDTPKDYSQYPKHGENLKSRMSKSCVSMASVL